MAVVRFTNWFLFCSLFFAAFPAPAAHLLKAYYNHEVDLSEQEILEAIDDVLNKKPSGHLVAYAHYLKALRYRKEKRNFKAFETYETALRYLMKADTTDPYLHHAILQNQGVILKQHWLLPQAVEKYREAMRSAYDFDLARALSIKHNLGVALAYTEPEKALKLFHEAAKEAYLPEHADRKATFYAEIGLIMINAGELDMAAEQLRRSLSVAQSNETKALALRYLASVEFYRENYEEQEKLLRESLDLTPRGKHQYEALRDLGECYLKQDQREKALEVLQEAANYYGEKSLMEENIRLFEWLALSSDYPAPYWRQRGDEFAKLAAEKKKLEQMSRQQAMENFLLKLEAEKEKKERVAFYRMLAIIVGALLVLLIITWKLWFRWWRRDLWQKVTDIYKIEK